MGSEVAIGNIKGVQQAILALEELRPELHNDLKDKMKSTAQQVAAQVDDAVPGGPPLSGFDHGGRTGWGRGRGSSVAVEDTTGYGSVEWPIYRVMMTGAASVMADIAGAGGRGNTLQGQHMIGQLNAGYGNASRWVWPVAKGAEGKIEATFESACEAAADTISAKLAEGQES